MGHSKIAEKGKASKNILNKKTNVIDPSKAAVIIVDKEHDVTLTIDNSLSRFANDPFILAHVKRAEEKFSLYKEKQ